MPDTNTPPAEAPKKARTKADEPVTEPTDVPAELLNETGTHVSTVAPNGLPWQCPVDYLPFALADGYTFADHDTDTKA